MRDVSECVFEFRSFFSGGSFLDRSGGCCSFCVFSLDSSRFDLDNADVADTYYRVGGSRSGGFGEDPTADEHTVCVLVPLPVYGVSGLRGAG